MVTSQEELDILRELRARSHAEGGVFWTGDNELAVFDPEVAQQVNSLNYKDLTLPPKLADVVRGRTGDPVSWKQIRSAWSAQLRRLAQPEPVARLAARMTDVLEQRLDRPHDLVWLAQEVTTQALLPTVVTGLPPKELAYVLRDQNQRIAGLLDTSAVPRQSLWKKLRIMQLQIRASLAIRRELRARAGGRRPRQLDLMDPIVELLPALGLDRAVGAVTAVLTAIAGPPGAAAACLLYELARRPDWSERLTRELEQIPPARLHEQVSDAPASLAPVTHRFVKETLRMWSPPLLMSRPVRTEIHLERACLKTGQSYLLSPHLIHHDPRNWKDPDTFDPDRWLPESERGPCSHASYVPFGFPPLACIGAGLGITQLMLLCQVLCTRYRMQLPEPEAIRMALGAAAIPLNFRGTLTRR